MGRLSGFPADADAAVLCRVVTDGLVLGGVHHEFVNVLPRTDGSLTQPSYDYYDFFF